MFNVLIAATPNNLLSFFADLNGEGIESYFVGGCVRDVLLRQAGFPSKTDDIDFVLTGVADADDLNQRMQNTFENVAYVGKSFPVWIVTINGEKYDIALARTEKSTGEGYNDFAVDTAGVTIEDDLYRRDLTINAIAVNCQTLKMVDPHNGLGSIKSGILSHVSVAFSEDPVRVLRLARFAARYGFEVSDSTIQMCKGISFASLDGERIGQELRKHFNGTPKNVNTFFSVLDSCGWLSGVFPYFDFSHEIFGTDFGVLSYLKNTAKASELLFFSNIKDEKNRKNAYNRLTYYNRAKGVLSIKDINTLVRLFAELKDTTNLNLFFAKFKRAGLDREILNFFIPIYTPSEDDFNDLRIDPIVTAEDLFALGMKQGKLFGDTIKNALYLQDCGKLTEDNKADFLAAL